MQSPVFPGAFVAEDIPVGQGYSLDLAEANSWSLERSPSAIALSSPAQGRLSPTFDGPQAQSRFNSVSPEGIRAPEAPQMPSPRPSGPQHGSSWLNSKFRKEHGGDACAAFHLQGTCRDRGCQRLHGEIQLSRKAAKRFRTFIAGSPCQYGQHCVEDDCIWEHPISRSTEEPYRVKIKSVPDHIDQTVHPVKDYSK
jgi:hypothetical protein